MKYQQKWRCKECGGVLIPDQFEKPDDKCPFCHCHALLEEVEKIATEKIFEEIRAERQRQNDFYCCAGSYQADGRYRNQICVPGQDCNGICSNWRRKWPTPEQYKEEYGEEYSEGRPVWVWYDDNWRLTKLKIVKECLSKKEGKTYVVCVCTPFDKPDADWRPQ